MIYKKLAQFLLHKKCCNSNVNATVTPHFLPKKIQTGILSNILYYAANKKVFAKEDVKLEWSNGRE